MYFKVIMKYVDNKGKHYYKAYANAYNETDVRRLARSGLIQNRVGDEIDMIKAISKEEYLRECSKMETRRVYS